MKKLLTLLLTAGFAINLTSCGDDDDPTNIQMQEELQQVAIDAALTALSAKVSTDATATGLSAGTNFDWTIVEGAVQTDRAQTEVEVTTNIDADTEWTADNVYILKGRITVLDGATLTIEAGTRIEGDETLTGVNAAVLMIARGGKLMAEGTAANPIIMTSTADDGTKTAADKGKWGGLVVLGKAPISAKTGSEAQIEGVPASDANGLYGGTSASDNSGTIEYVSIRHGGAVIDAAAGDEINGLTLGGVGSGTTIAYVEVYANSDDGIEFFGGSVDVDYAVVANVGDDAIDIDQSYAGTVSNFLVIVDGDSDEGLEVDGREGDLDDTFTLRNGTIESEGGASITCDFKSKAKGLVTNLNANGGIIKLAASFDAETLIHEEDAAKNVIDDGLTFSSINATFELYTKSFDE